MLRHSHSIPAIQFTFCLAILLMGLSASVFADNLQGYYHYEGKVPLLIDTVSMTASASAPSGPTWFQGNNFFAPGYGVTGLDSVLASYSSSTNCVMNDYEDYCELDYQGTFRSGSLWLQADLSGDFNGPLSFVGHFTGGNFFGADILYCNLGCDEIQGFQKFVVNAFAGTFSNGWSATGSVTDLWEERATPQDYWVYFESVTTTPDCPTLVLLASGALFSAGAVRRRLKLR